MFRKLGLMAAGGVFLATAAWGGPDDYRFEPVTAQLKQGDGVVVAVRLIHNKTRKPVTNAEIILKRIDMSPDAMGEMTSSLTPVPSPEPGVYAFKADLSMTGRWLLRVAAMVPGERQAVVGRITFRAAK